MRNAVTVAAVLVAFGSASSLPCGEDSEAGRLRLLADRRTEEPVRAIAAEYTRRTGTAIRARFLPAPEVAARIRLEKDRIAEDVVILVTDPSSSNEDPPIVRLPGATIVAWTYPSREPVRAAVPDGGAEARRFIGFAGGPTGHRLWSESHAGFTIVPDTSAAAYEWVAENRTRHTYSLTAMRMLAESGGIRQGICIDVGCGPGHLDVELARRSELEITGLDIDPGMKPLFERRMREAGLESRVSFVLGDAQALPFPDDHADLIVSRGVLIFLPDIGKCLREVHRVLKPTGVAFLGGRYLYAPREHWIPTEKLGEIVRESGVPGAQVLEARGQWVKITGPKAPAAARGPVGGPHMLALRCVADYDIAEGKCLLVCGNGGDAPRALQRAFLEQTDLELTALYVSDDVARRAAPRLRGEDPESGVTCLSGELQDLPFEGGAFDLVVGVGPVLIWESDLAAAMTEIHRVLRPGGAALVGGRYLHMPASRRVSSETLREAAAKTGIASIRVVDDMGQWVEILRGVRESGDGGGR